MVLRELKIDKVLRGSQKLYYREHTVQYKTVFILQLFTPLIDMHTVCNMGI